MARTKGNFLFIVVVETMEIGVGMAAASQSRYPQEPGLLSSQDCILREECLEF